jgi:hypothetical protein
LTAKNDSSKSDGLLATIRELQALESLREFAIAGGTSLAIRFNHRFSDDIDLFTNQTIGHKGLLKIENELKAFYSLSLINCEIINAENGDQFCFLRAFIEIKNGNAIKVEILQNMVTMHPFEMHNGIRILSVTDIGLFKLMSASNRKSRKDVYDLDIITEGATISDLLAELKNKHARFCDYKHKCLFDLDNELSPNDDLTLLLEFDKIDYTKKEEFPNHSTDILKIAPGGKSWLTAKSSWRRKVKMVMQERGIPPSPVKPQN